MICDVVSSLCGDDAAAGRMGLDICVAGPQKCLAGPPGLSLVTVSDEAWARIRANPAPARLLPLAARLEATWIDGRGPVPVHAVGLRRHALTQEEALQLGIDGLVALHTMAARASRAGCARWASISGRAATQRPFNCVTAVRTPDGIDTLAPRTCASITA